MKSQNNAVAAVVAAVYSCLHAEQEQQYVYVHAGLQPGAVAEQTPDSQAPRPPSNSWAISGRQAAMEMRRSRQMRLAR